MQLHYLQTKEVIDGMCYEEIGVREGDKVIFMKFPCMTVVSVRPTKEMQKRFDDAFRYLIAYRETCKLIQTATRRQKVLVAWKVARSILEGELISTKPHLTNPGN